MDVQQMRYAIAVDETGTFTAAARKCFVAQPSLSQSIKSLEGELGVQLFARVGRGVVVTAAGESFLRAARVAVRAFEAVAVEVGGVTGLVAGTLDLVALPTLALDPVAGLVGAFRRAHSQVRVYLAHPDGTDDLVRSIVSGQSEIGITETPSVTAGLTVFPFGRQEIVALFPPGSTVGRRITPVQLSAHPVVVQPVGTSTRTLLDAMLSAAGVTATIAVETDQREVVVPLVLDSAGVALLPRPMADSANKLGAVVVPLHPPVWRDLAVVHRPGPLSPAGRAFLHIAGLP